MSKTAPTLADLRARARDLQLAISDYRTDVQDSEELEDAEDMAGECATAIARAMRE